MVISVTGLPSKSVMLRVVLLCDHTACCIKITILYNPIFSTECFIHFFVASVLRPLWLEFLGITAKTRFTIEPYCATGDFVFAWLCRVTNFMDCYADLIVRCTIPWGHSIAQVHAVVLIVVFSLVPGASSASFASFVSRYFTILLRKCC